MAADLISVVNAVVADIEATVALGTHQTWKYSEPEIVRPDQLPMLAAWIESTDYTVVATPDQFERRHHVRVAWYVFSAGEAEYGGTGDQVVITSVDTTMEAIARRCVVYATGVPGMGPDVVATLVREASGPTEGIAWAGVIEIDVDTLVAW